MYQDADVPYRWSDAMCAGLAAKLSIKFAPERSEALIALAERSFQFASAEEGSHANLRIKPTGMNLY